MFHDKERLLIIVIDFRYFVSYIDVSSLRRIYIP